jgi:hypothetical protein
MEIPVTIIVSLSKFLENKLVCSGMEEICLRGSSNFQQYQMIGNGVITTQPQPEILMSTASKILAMKF